MKTKIELIKQGLHTLKKGRKKLNQLINQLTLPTARLNGEVGQGRQAFN